MCTFSYILGYVVMKELFTSQTSLSSLALHRYVVLREVILTAVVIYATVNVTATQNNPISAVVNFYGNNWALGYQMTSGEYLETALNCIQRELEYCDHSQTLVFMHSVAGGTGSGLGTRITEISNASHGVITFENETAKVLCQTTRSIERPTMTDINYTIVSNLIPIFLPKIVTKS
eukprot:gene35488-43752_t